jgi:hypothetical protein
MAGLVGKFQSPGQESHLILTIDAA